MRRRIRVPIGLLQDATAMRLWMYLAARQRGDKPVRLAYARMGVSRRYARVLVARLEQSGYLDVVRSGGKSRPNMYVPRILGDFVELEAELMHLMPGQLRFVVAQRYLGDVPASTVGRWLGITPRQAQRLAASLTPGQRWGPKKGGGPPARPVRSVCRRDDGELDQRILAQIAFLADENGWAWPSKRWLAKRLNCSPRTIARHLARMERARWIDRAAFYHRWGARSTNTLMLLPLGERLAARGKLTPRDLGTNPRAMGTNPRALGTNPRCRRKDELESNGTMDDLKLRRQANRPKEPPLHPAATAVADKHWETVRPRPSLHYVAFRRLVSDVLEAGYEPEEVQMALRIAEYYTVEHLCRLAERIRDGTVALPASPIRPTGVADQIARQRPCDPVQFYEGLEKSRELLRAAREPVVDPKEPEKRPTGRLSAPAPVATAPPRPVKRSPEAEERVRAMKEQIESLDQTRRNAVREAFLGRYGPFECIPEERLDEAEATVKRWCRPLELHPWYRDEKKRMTTPATRTQAAMQAMMQASEMPNQEPEPEAPLVQEPDGAEGIEAGGFTIILTTGVE